MPKASKHGCYAVPIGRTPGIYYTWAECEAQVKGFAGAVYKKLSTEAEAVEFMAAKPTARTSASHESAPIAATSRAVPQPISIHKIPQSIPEDEKDCDIVYCDGACKGNGQPGSIAGVGVWWGHGDPRNLFERCPGDQTNNRAELIAIVRILETTPHLKRRLLIKTDSNYSIQCVTSWISKWMSNGFIATNGKPVKNCALIKYLAALLHVRRKTSQTVGFKHVRGHVGIEGNEAADHLANLGATMPMVPERDWGTLERQALQSLKPVIPIKIIDEDLEAYADCLLDDDELADLADASVDNETKPAREASQDHPKSGEHVNQGRVSAVSHSTSLGRSNATGAIVPRPSSGMHSTNNLPSGGSIKATAASAPSRQVTSTISREELEVYAACLLEEDELATLGKDGVFDSDF